MRPLRVPILLLLAACAAACRAPSPVLPPGTPVVLISIDTLRSDRLPAYGYANGATPAIDALRRDGVLFARAYSQVPLTLPSHTSILSGLLPGAHGVRDNLGYPVDPERVPLLPALLRAHGYATGAAVSSYVLRGATGLSHGFDFYDDEIHAPHGAAVGNVQRAGAESTERAVDWLRGVAGRPFFLFLHLYEPHTPYDPPEPFASRFAQPYDGEVATSDAAVGRLLEALRELGLYDRALIVLLSDHGEGLGDHDEDEHGVFLYRSTLQVPLILKLPEGRRAGETVREPVALVDVAPTVCGLLDLPLDPRMSGHSLLEPEAADARAIYAETYYPRLHFGWSELTSLIEGRFHYIHGPQAELFDVERDPDELQDLAPGEGPRCAEYAGALAGLDAPIERPAVEDPETLRNLAALGYVGSAAAASSGERPDPRSRRDELRRIREAFKLQGAGRHAEAAVALREVLDDSPDLVDAWESYAKALDALGRRDEAIEAYREALRRSDGSPVLALAAAALLLRAGRLDDVAPLAEAGRASDPAGAETLLAQVALRQRRLDEAERHVGAALSRRPEAIVPLLVQAELLDARGRSAEALDRLTEVERAYTARGVDDVEQIRGLHLLRGKILAKTGEGPKAEAELRQEIALFPDQTAAYAQLAVLYGLIAGPGDVVATLDRMVEANPGPATYALAVRTARVLRMEPAARDFLERARRKYPGDAGIVALQRGGSRR